MRFELLSLRLVLFVVALSFLTSARAPASFDRSAVVYPPPAANIEHPGPQRGKVGKITRRYVCATVIGVLALASQPWRMFMPPEEDESTMLTYNLTRPLGPDSVVYPEDKPIVFEQPPRQVFGDVKLKLSMIRLNPHVGTHIDSPSHFLEDDYAPKVDQLDLKLFVGKMQVVDLSQCGKKITRAHLEEKAHLIKPGAKIFLRTSNSPEVIRSEVFIRDHAYLDVSAANYLVERQVGLVGFDYYSVDSSTAEGNLDSHVALASAHIPVIVNVDLTDLKEMVYHFAATPLQFVGLEASPATVVAFQYGVR